MLLNVVFFLLLAVGSEPAWVSDAASYRAYLHRIIVEDANESRRRAAVGALLEKDIADKSSIALLESLIFPSAESSLPVHASVAEEALRTLARLSILNSDLVPMNQVIAICTKKAQDPTPWIRATAAEGLYLLGIDQPEVGQAFIALLENTSSAEEARLRAVELLWLDKSPASLPLLARALHNSNRLVQLKGAQALIARGAPGDEAQATLDKLYRETSARATRARIREAKAGQAEPPLPLPEPQSCKGLVQIFSNLK